MERTRQAEPARPVEPLDLPMVPVALTGIGIWAVLAVMLLVGHDWVSTHGHTRWLWTCVAGVGWGLAGLYFMYRHDRRRRR